MKSNELELGDMSVLVEEQIVGSVEQSLIVLFSLNFEGKLFNLTGKLLWLIMLNIM